MSGGLTLLLSNGLAGGVLIVVTALLRRLFRGRVPQETFLALWGVGLLRLLTPVAPTSPLSLYRLFQPSSSTSDAPMVFPHLPIGGGAAPQGTFSDGSLLPLLWALVALALAFWFLTDWVRLTRSAKALPVAHREDPRLALLPAGVTLRLGQFRGAPLTFGLVRPTVILPPHLEGEALAHVLAHESAHIRRRDSLWSLFLVPALCLHWYNPSVWLMALLLKRDLELCCDIAVVGRLPGEDRAAYANTLITLAAEGKSIPLWCAGFGRHPAEERILHMMTFKRTGAVSLLLAVTLVAGTATALATAPAPHPSATVFQKEGSPNVFSSTSVVGGDELLPATPLPELIPYTPETYAADMELTRAELAQKVANGLLTQAEMDETMATQADLLAQLKAGAIQLSHAEVPDEDGVVSFLVSTVEIAPNQAPAK